MSNRKIILLAGMAMLVAACQDSDPVTFDGGVAPFNEELTADDAKDADVDDFVIIDPTTPRLALDFTAIGSLAANAPVTIRIEGVASEPITGGEVIVTLPTMAAMAYSGPDKRPRYPQGEELPVAARWQLPAMEAGELWERSISVGSIGNGYYQVAVEAHTRGPDSPLGPYMFNDVYREVWMFVGDASGRLTYAFDESLFPDGTAPVPGPLRPRNLVGTSQASAATGGVSASQNSGGVSVEVSFYHDAVRGFQPAVGARISGGMVDLRRGGNPSNTRTYTVPSSGIVSFPCPSEGYKLKGRVELPRTSRVEGATFLGFWDAYRSDCGDTVQAQGTRKTFLPWKNLDKAARLVSSHFGYSRGRLDWEVSDTDPLSHYLPGLQDKVRFGWTSYHDSWTAAHEYTHALHEKSLGGVWPATNCSNHRVEEPSSYTCAFLEGIADYGGNIGSPYYQRYGTWENWTSPFAGVRGQIEGYVAALFHDLIDTRNEGSDQTDLAPRYVMTVFKTCRIVGRRGTTYPRNDVSDFVWCLENRINGTEHGNRFPGISVPDQVREAASEPSDWDADKIRATWIQNVG